MGMFLFITKGMGWKWEYGHGNGREWDWKSHSRTSLLTTQLAIVTTGGCSGATRARSTRHIGRLFIDITTKKCKKIVIVNKINNNNCGKITLIYKLIKILIIIITDNKMRIVIIIIIIIKMIISMLIIIIIIIMKRVHELIIICNLVNFILPWSVVANDKVSICHCTATKL